MADLVSSRVFGDLTVTGKIKTDEPIEASGELVATINDLPTKTSELENNSGFLTSVDKSDLGLGNVDNVKQATKAEFDEHLAEMATFREQVEGGKAGGRASFSGSNLETTIAHNLGAIPTSAYCFPIDSPGGYLGEVWIRMDEINLYVGNTGSYTGEMVWTAIK